MTNELTSLLWVTALTAVAWVPYILNTIMVRGLIEAVGYPDNPRPLAPWAARMKAAHYNAVENLVVFAALVLLANAAGVSTPTTILACSVYFWARVVQWLCHVAGIPYVRTLAFAVSLIGLAIIFFAIVGGAAGM